MISAEHEVILRSTAQALWPLLFNIEQWPQWNPSIHRVGLQGPIQVGCLFKWKYLNFNFDSEIYTLKHQDRMAFTLKRLGSHGNLMIRLTPVHTGVHIKLRGQLHGLLPTIFKRRSKRQLDKMLQTFLNRVARTVKTGIPTTPSR